MRNFDPITESIFMTLAGYSKRCYEMLDTEDEKIKGLVIAAHKYFSRAKPRYNKVETKQLLKYMQKKIDVELTNLGKLSPQILLIITLDYLVNEKRHLLSRMKFSHFNYAGFIDMIYSNDAYKEHVKSHCNFLESIK